MPQFPECGVVTLNGDGAVFGLDGYFGFNGRHAQILLDGLPPIVHIRQQSDRAARRSAIKRIMQELREAQPGGLLVAQHLAHLMSLQALRIFMNEDRAGSVGWIYALGDRQISLESA